MSGVKWAAGCAYCSIQQVKGRCTKCWGTKVPLEGTKGREGTQRDDEYKGLAAMKKTYIMVQTEQ